MRKNITAVILFSLILCALGSLLFQCGQGGEAKRGGAAAAENPGGEKGGGKADGAPAESGTAHGEQLKDASTDPLEKDDLTLREELRPAILQIFCGDYRGSGVVWEITEEEVTVISSGHLLKNGETCDVLCCAGVYYEAKVDRVLEGCDIGFAVFPAQALREDGVELKAAVCSERGREELVRGEELAVYGSMDSVAENFVKGYLIEPECEMQLEGYGNAQPMMLGGIIREETEAFGYAGMDPDAGIDGKDGDAGGKGRAAGGSREESNPGNAAAESTAGGEEVSNSEKGAVDAGMSGSGVFDRRGNLLGIVAGGDGEEGFAAVPVWRIREQVLQDFASPSLSKEFINH